jgi:hypothetical protein
MQLIPLLFSFLLLLPLSTFAETIDLVCTDNTGFSVVFEVNTSQRTVLANRRPSRNVNIDKNVIIFTLDLDGDEFYHSINRSTGVLTILNRDKVMLSPYKCERAKPKF